jgi:GT2 family glycosyltransferase
MNPSSAAVIVLCQPAETHVTALTLHHLVDDLDDHTAVHVLMNGGLAGELRALAPSSSRVAFHSSPANLGVAGGRNFLLGLPEVRAADVIVILDNDVITPPGHIERLTNALRADPRAGVIGPAILNLPAVAESLGTPRASLRVPIDNSRLTGLGEMLLGERAWFHLGTNPDWRSSYIHELHIEQMLVERAGARVEAPFFAMNHQDPKIRSAVASGSMDAIAASNVAGCCQAFRSEVLDEVGLLMDEFSPYGFEDVDFCIRVAQTGRKNYIVPAISMLHGTDGRHLERKSAARITATQRNFMRCKALLAWRHAGAVWRHSVEGSIVRRYALARQSGSAPGAAAHVRAHVAGYLDAQRQIRHAAAHKAALAP